MRIVCDQNIPYAARAFGRLGEVTLVEGRALSAQSVREADALLVRSVTPVNAGLLDGSRVRFVGTATIGFDHVDVAYLAGRGIGFATAAGSNANSVAEYVVAALLEVAADLGWDLASKALGVVGVGNVGRRVVRYAEALGMPVLPNDPPRRRAEGGSHWVDLATVCTEADVVTLHVPLTRTGEDATLHLFDAGRIARMKPGAMLINTARGAVVRGDALRGALEAGELAAAVLDVWEGEPDIDTALLERVALGSPHVAGYSLDGKAAGVQMMHDALCGHFGVVDAWDVRSLLPAPQTPEVAVDGTADPPTALRDALRGVWDLRRDDAALREMRDRPPEQRGRYFDRLRKDYPVRREWHNTRTQVVPPRAEIARTLANLGFRTG